MLQENVQNVRIINEATISCDFIWLKTAALCLCVCTDVCTRRVTGVRLTGLECSTVKKSGLHRNLALGDCSSRDRRERPLE